MDGPIGLVLGIIIILQLGWIRQGIDKTNSLLAKQNKKK